MHVQLSLSISQRFASWLLKINDDAQKQKFIFFIKFKRKRKKKRNEKQNSWTLCNGTHLTLLFNQQKWWNAFATATAVAAAAATDAKHATENY